MKKTITFFTVLFLLTATAIPAQKNWTETVIGKIITIQNKGGQTIAYSADSGVKILTVDGFAFKDLNRNGKLDKYEDWSLPFDERAKDLASQMSVEQIAGLMLYSRHQSIPARTTGYFAGTYKGKTFTQGETNPTDLTDQQLEFL
ncbi:MAG: beta-glucosidase, partial [Bacteroidota bacterium]